MMSLLITIQFYKLAEMHLGGASILVNDIYFYAVVLFLNSRIAI